MILVTENTNQYLKVTKVSGFFEPFEVLRRL